MKTAVLNLACVAVLACAGPPSPDDPTPTDVPDTPTDTPPTGDSDPHTDDTDDTDLSDIGEPYHKLPYVTFIGDSYTLQGCLLQDGLPAQCFRDAEAPCPREHFPECVLTEVVPTAPTRRVEEAVSSFMLLTHGPDGAARVRTVRRDEPEDEWTIIDHPPLLGGQPLIDVVQGGFGYLYGLSSDGRVIPIPDPEQGVFDDVSFPSDERYRLITADAGKATCALTTADDIVCTPTRDVPFSSMPPLTEPIRRIATGGGGIGCAITQSRRLSCDTEVSPDPSAALLPPPEAIQGDVHDVAIAGWAMCATGEGHRPVCWRLSDFPGVVEATRALIAAVPDLPLRDLAVQGTVGAHVACGTHLIDETIHCWGDPDLLDVIPFGTKHHPPDP